jgi:hypothetical protein
MRLLDFSSKNVLNITRKNVLIRAIFQLYRPIQGLQQIDHNGVISNSRSLG